MGRMCLVARRLVERGVRFVQIYDDGWDAHTQLIKNHSTDAAPSTSRSPACSAISSSAGCLDETLVVWGTEFGRTPGAEKSDGRGPSPLRFLRWMAGGGLKGASSTVPRTSWVFTPSSTGTTSPTCTPRSCNQLASTRTAWKSPATSGWRSTLGSRSERSSGSGLLARENNKIGIRACPAGAADDAGDLAAMIGSVGHDVREDVAQRRDPFWPAMLRYWIGFETSRIVLPIDERGIAGCVLCGQNFALRQSQLRPDADLGLAPFDPASQTCSAATRCPARGNPSPCAAAHAPSDSSVLRSAQAM